MHALLYRSGWQIALNLSNEVALQILELARTSCLCRQCCSDIAYNFSELECLVVWIFPLFLLHLVQFKEQVCKLPRWVSVE